MATESDSDDEETESDPWEGLDQPGSTYELEDQTQTQSAQPLEKTCRELRQYIGYVDAERDRVRHGGRKKPTKKQAVRLGRLRRRFGRGRFSNKRLLAIREKLTGLLRVKTLQIRQQRWVDIG